MIYICILLAVPSFVLFILLVFSKKISNKTNSFIRKNSLPLQFIAASITISSALYIGFVQNNNYINITKEQYYLTELNKIRNIKGLYARVNTIADDFLDVVNNPDDKNAYLGVDLILIKNTTETIQQIPYLDIPNDQIALDLTIFSSALINLSNKWNDYISTKDKKILNDIKFTSDEIVAISLNGIKLTASLTLYYENKISNIDSNDKIYRAVLNNGYKLK